MAVRYAIVHKKANAAKLYAPKLNIFGFQANGQRYQRADIYQSLTIDRALPLCEVTSDPQATGLKHG